MIAWQCSLHFAFIWMNEKEDCRLFLRWIMITNEAPTKGDTRVVGLSRKENNEFRQTERRFNRLYYRFADIAIYGLSAVIAVQYFFVRFEIDLCLQILVQAIHVGCFYLFGYLIVHCICDPSIFHLGASKLLAKKFRFLSEKVMRMNASTKLIDKRRLAWLIREHNRVSMELFEMNSFFKVSIQLSFKA